MLQTFLLGVGLVFIFEGLSPFLIPGLWRRAMQQMLMQNDRALRIFGLVSMLIGLGIMYWVR